MATPKPASVADYEAACSPEGRAALATVRDAVTRLAPVHEERLSYGIPTFFVGGRRLVHVASWAGHLALYPIPPTPPDDPTLAADLRAVITGKGTLHFRYAAGLPVALLERIVRAHLAALG